MTTNTNQGEKAQAEPIFAPHFTPTKPHRVADLSAKYFGSAIAEVRCAVGPLMRQPHNVSLVPIDKAWCQEHADAVSVDRSVLSDLRCIQSNLFNTLMEHRADNGHFYGPEKDELVSQVLGYSSMAQACTEVLKDRTLDLNSFGQLLPGWLALISAMPQDGIQITAEHVEKLETFGLKTQEGRVTCLEWYLLLVNVQRTLESRWLQASVTHQVVYLAMQRGGFFAHSGEMLQRALMPLRATLQPDSSKPLPTQFEWIDSYLRNPFDAHRVKDQFAGQTV